MHIKSQKDLEKLRESELHKLLKSLFEKMGYQDVQIMQGTNEQGKDLVMWKEDDFHQRVNYAVVVKAKKITGRAGTDIATITTQVQQAFGSTFPNKISGEAQNISKCFIVSSHEITPQAISSMKAALHDKAINIIAGDTLWQHWQQYFPIQSSSDKLYEVVQEFNTFSPYWGVDIQIQGTTITRRVVPKTFDANERQPIILTVRSDVPSNDEGMLTIAQIQKDFDDLIRKGSPLRLLGEYTRIEIPNFLEPLIGHNEIGGDIMILPVIEKPDIVLQLEIVNATGEKSLLTYVPCMWKRHGTDEAEIVSNDDINSGYKLSFVVRRNFTCDMSFQIFYNTSIMSCLQNLGKPYNGACQENEGVKVTRGFIVACGNTP
jgi:hypothetical protein